MHNKFISASVLVGAAGCFLFPFGGFMLFPVALDLWEHGSTDKTTDC